MELEDEISQILKDKPEGLTVHAIANQLMEKGIFNKNDSKVCYFQVHARIYNMPDKFIRKGEKVKLKQMPQDTNH
jgi:hypothetical protein